MPISTAQKTFPCYRNEKGDVIFSEEDIPSCAKKVERKGVYRLCFKGIVDEEAFQCSYTNKIDRGITMRPRELKRPTCFATSCFSKKNDALVKRSAWISNNPLLVIAVGNITVDSGVSCTDHELNNDDNYSHINWWIYREYNASNDFSKCEEGIAI